MWGGKNKKEFANDLKTIYQAPSKKAAQEQFERVTAKREGDYPNAMKSWLTNWDMISPKHLHIIRNFFCLLKNSE